MRAVYGRNEQPNGLPGYGWHVDIIHESGETFRLYPQSALHHEYQQKIVRMVADEINSHNPRKTS